VRENAGNNRASRGVARTPAPSLCLPGFLIEEEIGLGDAIKRVTYAMGIKPCGGCKQRADVVFAFTNRTTDVVSKQAVGVDVTDEFPFLVTKLSPYYDR
jgi:hypothetical protein